MPETVCALCVHLFVIEGGGASPRRCPRCRKPLPSVHRETLTHLRQVQGRGQRPAFPAAGGRFRATVRTLPGAPWIAFDAMETLSTTLVNAVDRAASGQRDEGYACLLDGLRAAEANAAAGALWGAALIRCYRELLDDYAVRYDLCRGAEAPRAEPRLLAEMALMEFAEYVQNNEDSQ